MIERPSPNQNARSHPVRLIVLHNDASPKESATISWTRTPESKVSYHVLIGRDGTPYRLVPDERRAWAVGVSLWQGVKDVNGISLNLAFSNRNDGKEPLTEAQLAAAKSVIADWRSRWPIEAVTTHKLVARPIGRKHDPEAAPNFRLQDFL
jgi:N-acetyl-anhydromuramyl-L-alanine amidase AmpD